MRWNLRQAMALRGMFQTSDLLEPLAARGVALSRQYVHKLVTTPPQRINTELLAALCDILECDAAELLVLEVAEQARPKAANGEAGPAIGTLRPVRAAVRRPGPTV
jgi:DNA-binding Xre family transcriptional regulator